MTEETKNLLTDAPPAAGVDRTAVGFNGAAERMRWVLSEVSMLKLDAEEHAPFVHVLSNPPSPTPALQQLMQLPELPTR